MTNKRDIITIKYYLSLNFSMSCINKVSRFGVNWIWFAWMKTKLIFTNRCLRKVQKSMPLIVSPWPIRELLHERVRTIRKRFDWFEVQCELRFVFALTHGFLLRLDLFDVWLSEYHDYFCDQAIRSLFLWAIKYHQFV